MATVIQTIGLSRKFGSFTAVDSIDLTVNSGEVCGFLGPNGAGKTTAIRMLCGILAPSSGSARVLGFDVARESDRIKPLIGYMSQRFSLYNGLTVWDNLEFYASVYGIPSRERKRRIEEMVSLAGLGGKEVAMVAALSPGMKQRLALGCALVARPALIFLDEPTSGVSPTARRQFFNIIQGLAAGGASIIVSTHFMDEAERCDKIAFFHQGRLLAQDGPDQLKSNLQGCLLGLDLPDPMERMQVLQSLPFVRECNFYGLSLRLLVDSVDRLGDVQRIAGVRPAVISPSLGDVFVSLLHEGKQERRGTP